MSFLRKGSKSTFFDRLFLIIKEGYCQQYLVNILFCIKKEIVNDVNCCC